MVSRLKKVILSKSVNLGELIDSNSAIETIKQTFPNQFATNELRQDVAPNNAEAIWGVISDNGLVAAELYCFKQSDCYTGVAVGAKIDVTDASAGQYTVDSSYDCVLLNPNETDTISNIKAIMTSGITLCGMSCTFNDSIKNIDQLLQMLNNK